MTTPASILVIDDEPTNLLLMEALLVPMGYAVNQANSGARGLQLASRQTPDVILLDVMMPGMNGYEVARRLRDNPATRLVPIVMVTALNAVEDRVKAIEAGADDFLAKPIEKAELYARVRSLVKVKAYHDHMASYQQQLEVDVVTRTQQLNRALEALKSASLDTIYLLSKVSEYRDEQTGFHIKRMSHYTAALARTLGLAPRTVERVLYAAPMHDIGKIGIPDRILLKPGKLDAQEWHLMKQHTVYGAQILTGPTSGYLPLARIIALTHHERWDGNGYPQGLKGRQIPRVGRIAALADVFDALTTARPYKQAFAIDKAFGIIREGIGTHFDPEIVEAFFTIEDEILAIKERFRDGEPEALPETRPMQEQHVPLPAHALFPLPLFGLRTSLTT